MTDIQLFVTCLVDAFAPGVGRATVRVLERAGCTVFFPEDQTCCGQPAHNAGHAGTARAMAARTVDVLDRTVGPVVIPSGSCADMLIHHTPLLLAGTRREAAAHRVAARVRELTCFLVDDLSAPDLLAPDLPVSDATSTGCDGCVVALQSSCHGLRNLGIRAQPAALLAAVEGATRVEPADPEQCCGFGGLFSVEMPDLSGSILAGRIEAFETSGADTVVGGDVSCLMHLEGGLHRRGSDMRVEHIAEFLDRHHLPRERR